MRERRHDPTRSPQAAAVAAAAPRRAPLLPRLKVFEEVDARGGLVVDLGCGNGWYLRALGQRFPRLRGLGLDGFGENIRQATVRAEADGLGARLRFSEGDLFTFHVDEPVDVER